MEVSNKKTIIVAVVIIVVLIIVVALFSNYSRQEVKVQPSGTAPSLGHPIGGGQFYNGSSTKSAAPAYVEVPGATSTNLPPNVAKPQTVTRAAPGVSANYRSFNISISNNEYSPSSVIVNQGDTVHISFTAADKDYDFTQPDYGLRLEIPKGSTKVAEFQAVQSGKFTFFCLACGGPAKGPVGYLTVAAK